MERRRAAALTAALAAVWLAAGWANVARGARHAGPDYRFWAFQHHCYSDVIALHGDRYLGGGRPLPYVEDRIEYPVLLGLALFAPSLLPGGRDPLVHFTATYLLLAACLAVALLALLRLPGARPWWLGATPALVYYAGLNWDLLPIALLALALLAHERARPAASGALAALGACAKLFPVALVPPALASLAALRRGATRFAIALLAVVAGLYVPLALAAPSSWSWFLRFNAGRGAENSVFDALHVGPGLFLDAFSLAPLGLATLAGALLCARAASRGGDAGRTVRLATALALVAWIATNKVWSPQYALWGFLAGALAAAPLPLFLVLSAASAIDFHLAFEVRARRWEPWFRDAVWQPGNVVRTILWLLLAAWIARELWRAARAKGPAPAADLRSSSTR